MTREYPLGLPGLACMQGAWVGKEKLTSGPRQEAYSLLCREKLTREPARVSKVPGWPPGPGEEGWRKGGTCLQRLSVSFFCHLLAGTLSTRS